MTGGKRPRGGYYKNSYILPLWKERNRINRSFKKKVPFYMSKSETQEITQLIKILKGCSPEFYLHLILKDRKSKHFTTSCKVFSEAM